jgi:hypothetical protein
LVPPLTGAHIATEKKAMIGLGKDRDRFVINFSSS